MQVRLIAKTTGAIGTEYEGKSIDEMIVGIARLSSSRNDNELFDEPEKLIRYLLLNQHWSPFEMCNLTFEIVTSRAISRELLRHRNAFQEISQRYTDKLEFESVELRMQSKNNRQSSTEVFNPILDDGDSAGSIIQVILWKILSLYRQLIGRSVSRETARFILPECTKTKIIMTASIRNVITFLNVRLHKTAQKEMRLLAQEIAHIMIAECPVISKALHNFEGSYETHFLNRLVIEKELGMPLAKAKEMLAKMLPMTEGK